MRLAVDTNVIISSLIKDSITRKIILLEDLKLYTPEYVFIELEKHIGSIQVKSKMSKSNI